MFFCQCARCHHGQCEKMTSRWPNHRCSKRFLWVSSPPAEKKLIMSYLIWADHAVTQRLDPWVTGTSFDHCPYGVLRCSCRGRVILCDAAPWACNNSRQPAIAVESILIHMDNIAGSTENSVIFNYSVQDRYVTQKTQEYELMLSQEYPLYSEDLKLQTSIIPTDISYLRR